MTFKPGVTIHGIQTEMILGLIVADEVYAKNGAAMVVTSCTEGHHMSNSLHYTGQAADLRTNGIPVEKVREIVKNLRDDLPSAFDVVLEDDHIHIEYDPIKAARIAQANVKRAGKTNA